MIEKIQSVQKFLNEHDIDGWLLYEFDKCNEIARKFLCVQQLHISRRLFYYIPRKGEPTLIAHGIESHQFDALPGKHISYMGWGQMYNELEEMLREANCICMEYSPSGAIPYLSKVDAGTVEMVQGCGVSVVSSGFLLGHLTSTLSQEQIQLHKTAVSSLQEIVAGAWDFVGSRIKKGTPVAEGDVRDYILDEMLRCNLHTENNPIVACGPNSAMPHYFPKEKGQVIGSGDFLLIDLWGKCAIDGAIFGDITRVGCLGDPTPKQEKVFRLVLEAQQAAISFVEERFSQGEVVKGFEVDEIARDVIREGGFEQYFTHRLGHNIGEKLHGHGTHLDSFETLDDRSILTSTCFSVEPGIYIPGEFGVRLETDVVVDRDGKIEVTGGLQNQIACII